MKAIWDGLKAFLISGTVRRIVMTLVGVAITALSTKLGLNLSEEQQLAIAAMVVGYLFQSAHTEAIAMKSAAVVTAAEAGKAAAATVNTTADALKALDPK